MARLKPEDIMKMVDAQEADREALRQRMESDYNLYVLSEHQNTDPKTTEALDGYAVYTSNEPRNFANKIISWLTDAELLPRVPHMEHTQHDKVQDNLKERFIIGALRQADERLENSLQPSLRAQLAFYVCIRGGYVGGRCLLVKRSDGTTYVDIQPWDPMHTYAGIGADGLVWAAYKIKKTRQQIQDEYGIKLPPGMGQEMGSTDPEKEGLEVYDYYDGEINTTVMHGKVLKRPTPHGMGVTPVFMRIVGNIPLLQPMIAKDAIAQAGESLYESERQIYSKHNDIASVLLELVMRSRRQGLKVKSRDGQKTLPEDPFVEGTELSLAEGEDVEGLGLLEMAKETGAFLALVSGEMQRGSLPHSAYGELQFQLSGFAINTLRQGIETVLTSRLHAIEGCYLQIARLLVRHYRTGAFEAMRLSGVDMGRKYFSEVITPEALEDTCEIEMKLMAQLPQDDMSKFAMAQIAREGQSPLLSDVYIRDNVLGLQDSEMVEEQVKLQLAERALPTAGLYTLMVAAENQGRSDLAAFYYQALLMAMGQQMGIMPPQGAVPGMPGAGGPPGIAPQALPNAALGVPPSPATSNGGPAMVAPGMPRPGAQNGSL